MTTTPKLPKLLKCPVCGKAPKMILTGMPGPWDRIGCVDSMPYNWHKIVAVGRTPLAAAKRWNKMVGVKGVIGE